MTWPQSQLHILHYQNFIAVDLEENVKERGLTKDSLVEKCEPVVGELNIDKGIFFSLFATLY
uniref:Uncharacterized protein n=1 Tax=Arion vulgaris TaxID=1028688 RepID=A0A0B7AJ22_9EUPU